MPMLHTEADMAGAPDDRRRGARITALVVGVVAVAVYLVFVLSAML